MKKFSYIFIQMMYSMSQGSTAQSVSLGLPISSLKNTLGYVDIKWMFALPQ